MKSPFALKARQVWLLLFLLVFPGVSNLFLYGLPTTHDGITHLWRIARLHDSIQNLVLFPRWLPEMLLGFGYPVLNYYASTTYYLVEIIASLGLGLHRSYIAVPWLLMWLAAVGMYTLAKDTYSPRETGGREQVWAALVAAIAYAYGPYLIINIYLRSAIAEIGAQALIPWLFWGFQRIWRAEKPQHYVVFAGLTLAALAFTHTISLLIVPPLLVAYNIVMAFSSTERKWRGVYAVTAILCAMGISCFFWGPLLLERGYVAHTGFDIAVEMMLPAAFLAFSQLVDPHFFFAYAYDRPLTLGLVQASGAIVGLVVLIWLVRSSASTATARRNEWFFWVGTALVCVLLMLSVSEPFWYSNEFLAIIQFPWRLLAILQLPIALLTGLSVTLLRPRLLQATAAIALMAMLIYVHLPTNNIAWEYRFDARTAQYNIGIHAHYDAIRGTIVEGLRQDLATQEFRPRWTDESMRLDPASVEEAPGQDDAARTVTLVAANSYHLQVATESATAAPLRLAGYYFPGWAAIMDGREELQPYPSTNLGLLTVDVPAGEHRVDIVWRGTLVQSISALISQITLVLLSLVFFWWRPLRSWLLATMSLLALALLATYLKPPLVPLHSMELSTSPPGLEFLGYTPPTLDEEGIKLRTYWFVTKTQPAAILTHLQLLREGGDNAGEVVQALTASPYYNSYSSQLWASNTVVDDGYWIPLPPGLAAGDYRLRMTVLDEESGVPYDSLDVGIISIPQATARLQPSQPLGIHFEHGVMLEGYDFSVVEPNWQRQRTLSTKPEIHIVDAGQTVAYTLFWQSDQPTKEQYIGFIHLLDYRDRPYAQQDHATGPLFQPSAIWTPYGLYPDSYQLSIPDRAPSGLYVPDVGMYNWRDEHRFEVRVPGVAGVGDHYELPPIKVVNPSVQPTGTRVEARFDEFAHLRRFQVERGQDGLQEAALGGGLTVRPGDMLTLTTYYEANAPTSMPLTRYIQVRNDQNEILAQYDSEPQQGSNPSWAWVPGEIVADAISLGIPADAPNGHYTLYLGWYDAAANFAHLPTYDRQGNRFANDEVPLLRVVVTP